MMECKSTLLACDGTLHDIMDRLISFQSSKRVDIFPNKLIINEESINALPTHKFKVKRKGNSDSKDNDSGVDEGGILAAGTDKERAISGEDAVCCICLAKYADNDLLRELPCLHFFHIECVDKWLKINASCPLCKFEIGSSSEISSTEDSNQQQA